MKKVILNESGCSVGLQEFAQVIKENGKEITSAGICEFYQVNNILYCLQYLSGSREIGEVKEVRVVTELFTLTK